MVPWFVRLVIVFLVWRGLSRLFAGIQEGLRGPRDGGERTERTERTSALPLARDPVCGTYVVPSHAVTTGSGSDARFFCSETCRRAYAARRAS